MKMSDVAILRREVEVTTVPYGEKMTLLPGQEVLVTQAMGASFTLNVMGNLVYLDGKDVRINTVFSESFMQCYFIVTTNFGNAVHYSRFCTGLG